MYALEISKCILYAVHNVFDGPRYYIDWTHNIPPNIRRNLYYCGWTVGAQNKVIETLLYFNCCPCRSLAIKYKKVTTSLKMISLSFLAKIYLEFCFHRPWFYAQIITLVNLIKGCGVSKNCSEAAICAFTF